MIRTKCHRGLLAWLLVPTLALSGCLGGGGGGGGDGGGLGNANQATTGTSTTTSPDTPGDSTTPSPSDPNQQIVATSPLPHSGINASYCFQAGSDDLVDCASAGAIALSGEGKQDGMYSAANPMSYSAVGSFSKEECVKDNVTGLVWEGKTASGLRAGGSSYTNYDLAYGTQANAATNTYGYVAYVNSIALCGYTDWRLPSVEELLTLVDYGMGIPNSRDSEGISSSTKGRINTEWFPNSHYFDDLYWASTPRYSNSSAGFVDFYNGLSSGQDRNVAMHVRLVRGHQ